MLLDNITTFLDTLLNRIAYSGVHVENLVLDHLAFQTSSSDNYEEMKVSTSSSGDLKGESVVGDRRVSVFKLKNPITYKHYLIPAVELIEPVSGEPPKVGFDHIEFVLNETFDSFISKYPDLVWDLKAQDREKFPKISLHFPEGSVKFHLKNILEEI